MMNQKRVLAGVLIALAGIASSAGAQNDARAVDTYNAASGMLSRGLNDLAIDEYRRFLDGHSDHELADQARYGLAVAASRLGQHEDVVEALEPLLTDRRFLYAMESSLLTGRSLIALGEYREAAGVLERSAAQHADHRLISQAATLLVEARYRADQPERAISAYEEYESDLDETSGDRAAYFAGLAEAKLGRHQSATGRFARIGRGSSPLAQPALLAQGRSLQALGRLENALQAFERGIELAQGGPAFDAKLGAAQVLSDLGRHDEAKEMVDQIQTRQLSGDARCRLDLEHGRILIYTGDYASAVRLFERVNDDGPEHLQDDAAYWHARALSESGNAEEAVRVLRAAVQEHRRSELLPEMTYELGLAQGATGDHDAAIETLRRFSRDHADHKLRHQALLAAASFAQSSDEQGLASRLADEAADGLTGDAAIEARFLSAESAYQQGDYQSAARQFARLVEDVPTSHRLSGTSCYRLGMSLRQIGQTQEARAVLADLYESGQQAGKFEAGLLALGDMAYSDEDWGEAADWLGRYVELGVEVPSWEAAALRLGLALTHTGDRRAAQRVYTQIVRTGSPTGAPRAHYELGLVLLGLGESEEAVAAFEDAADLGDEEVSGYALRQLAQLARDAGDDSQAAEYFSRAAESSDGSLAEASSLEQARALLTSGSYEGAARVLARLAEGADQAEVRVQARALSVIALARFGEHERAVDASDVFVRRDTMLDEIEPQTAASMLYERGRSLVALERLDAAADSFTLVTEKFPQDRLTPHSRLELAVIAMDDEDYEVAAAHLEDLLLAVEDDRQGSLVDQAAYRLGVCARHMDDHARAIEVLYDLATREPVDRTSASAALLAGESNLKLGKLSEAQALFEIACDHDDDSIRPVAMLRLGEVFGGLQYWSRAEEIYTEFLRDYAGDGRSYLAQFGSAWSKENQGRHDEAIEEYGQIVGYHDGETAARAQFQIGECLFAQGKHEDAVREFLRVDLVYAYPQWSAAALYEAGRCFEELGRDADATSQYTEVVDRFAQTDWAPMAERRLERLMPRTEQGG